MATPKRTKGITRSDTKGHEEHEVVMASLRVLRVISVFFV